MNNNQIVHFPVSIQYALRGLIFLARRPLGETFKVEEIAMSENLPCDLLGKIFQKLSSANILNSKRGPGGGYSLVKPTDKIHISEIVNIFFNSNTNGRLCLLGLGLCGSNQNCPIHDVVMDAENQIVKLLGNSTLKELQQKQNNESLVK